MSPLFVVRHCRATGQDPGAPLTPDGIEAATRLADVLRGFGIRRIRSSPYRRALDTIKPFSRISGIPTIVDERLMERKLSGTALEDWLECLRRTFDDFNISYPGGESSREAMLRILSFVEEVWKEDDSPAVLVSHGNLISLLVHSFDSSFGFEGWKRMTNPDLFRVTRGDTGMKVERIPLEMN